MRVKIADEVWIATALLHREQEHRGGFTVDEIVARVQKEGTVSPLRPGVVSHAALHCVANCPPSPYRTRMLFAAGLDRRRLFREGDASHPLRNGTIMPARRQIPQRYRYLIDWYEVEYAARPESWLAGIRESAGLGREIFAGVDIDDYVRFLRAGW